MSHAGIHHVTAVSGPAPRNLDFYSAVLGLRLVKKTVNFDDPGTYHLYYGDEVGQPGTIVTFFPWAHAAQGRVGPGETQEIALRAPAAAIGFWAHRFLEKGVDHDGLSKRFGETVLTFRDPDGMHLALIGVPGIEAEPAWAGNDIAVDHAVRGLHSVTLLERDGGPTGAILTDVLGFAEDGREDTTVRYRAKGTTIGGVVDIRTVGDFPPGKFGTGSIHHLAFRAADDAAEAAMVEKLVRDHGIRTTEQKDRNYFRSVYFREPGHVLFEIATDVPGFDVDEPRATLGEALKLPAFLEPRRAEIEAALGPLA
ncbi:ring-cleaving dioxygenase [Kaistia dalseonensis]|uniref:Glyoxalase family protein n=1 Tax=Kaistia dalseonensis TaxID=410840 RepID=A0ABU0H278_9HYPH|nr:ring-cleaving dioxygenase [Kaistia dalseonensis]MCX5493848.1 ring-cleaving dioxygenase [Kaistia dalseonensis]MDQ0436413.1 glyoxalase family protein [Kaistia dalseonensis]